MKTLIVDNEKNIRSGLRKLCSSFLPFVEVIAEAGTVSEAYDILSTENVELIFLDIQLGDGSGFDLLHRFSEIPFQIIFITAFDQYAIEAFRFSAVDYLLKPIDPDELIKAGYKANDLRLKASNAMRLNALLENISRPKSERLVLNDNESTIVLNFSDIIYFLADGAYTHVQTSDKKYTSTKNLKYYEQLLTETAFFRCHHSYLVNLNHFNKYDKPQGVLILTNKVELPVSFRKRELLQEKLKELYF